MSPAPLQLWLIRHGQTAWSLSGQHTGRTEQALTAAGQAMARQLAPALAAIPFVQVLSSPRRRARDTCALAGLGRLAEVDDDLAEWDYGDYEGQRTADILQQRPGWDLWRDGCPGGELPAEVGQRADRLIHRLAPTQGAVALFSHGQFGRVLAARWIGWPVAQGQHFILDPASLSCLGREPSHPQRRVIALWNATAHLGGRPAPGG